MAYKSLAGHVHAALAKDHTDCTEDCTPDTYTPHWMTEEEVREVLVLATHLFGTHEPGKERPKTGPKPDKQEPEAQPEPCEEPGDDATKSGAEDSCGNAEGAGETELPAEAGPEASGQPEVQGADDAEAKAGPQLDKISEILKALREKASQEGKHDKWKPGPETTDFVHKHGDEKAKSMDHVGTINAHRTYDYDLNREITRYQGGCTCGWESPALVSSIGAATNQANRHIDQVGGE